MTGDVTTNEVRQGSYADSVALMRLSQSIVRLAGVQEAALMMGTPANLEILENARLLTEVGREAVGGDLIIAVRADSSEAADHALAEAAELLANSAPVGSTTSAWKPQSIRAAVKSMPEANLALISVPGDFAAAEARKAIRRGMHAMIFSDNVSIDDEVALKREARELGCLVMGPDCGTTILNGTPLAFANQVRRGNIGLIGASGTGIQEVSCLIDRSGGGISHAIGVGGRDLSREVGGISTLIAIDMLEEDPETEHLVLISKPPPVDVATRILELLSQVKKPATICFIGADTLPMPANATQVATLQDAAEQAIGRSKALASSPTISVQPGRKVIRGLYSGGTLCAEAQVIFKAANQELWSNAPIPGVPSSKPATAAHALLDLGADEFTKGKPHPMIDPSVRDQALLDAISSDQTAIILLDVVIGFGSHADPAGHVVSALSQSTQSLKPLIIASVTGTDADPQNRSSQVAKLEAAGIHVAPTNAAAAEWALAALRSKQ